LNDIGFILIGEVEDFIIQKKKFHQEFYDKRAIENLNVFEKLKASESVLFEEAKINFEKFVHRWKNIKLKGFLEETIKILNSEEFVDNKERYELLENLKKDQDSIYQERLKLINKQVTMHFEEITCKKVENLIFLLEEINNKAQALYDAHSQKLLDFSDRIIKASMNEIEVFKNKVKTIRYDFPKEDGQEELINDELIPIINKSKAERKEYQSKIILYIDDYDDYIHNCCLRILRIFKELGKKIDEHKVSKMF